MHKLWVPKAISYRHPLNSCIITSYASLTYKHLFYSPKIKIRAPVVCYAGVITSYAGVIH